MTSEWIEVNLPWDFSSSFEDEPPMPNLSVKEKEHFGVAFDELREKLQIDALEEEFESYAEHIMVSEGIQPYSQQSYSSRNSSRVEFEKLNPALIEYRNKCEERDVWEKSQPEFLAWKEELAAFREKEKEMSFVGRGLAKPGTLVELSDGKIELLGTMNCIGGGCDHCSLVSRETIIKRYKIAYDFLLFHPKAADETSS